jgi:hypothetical protein
MMMIQLEEKCMANPGTGTGTGTGGSSANPAKILKNKNIYAQFPLFLKIDLKITV